MNVIFLDVDGVLNSYKFAEKMREEGVDVFREDILNTKSLRLLKQLCEKSGAIIVLSSSWRRIPEARKNLVSQLQNFGLEIHSDTPHRGGCRGNDITGWFNRHPDISVEHYVILDDDSDMDVHMMHLVKTSFYDWGFDAKAYRTALEMLGCQPTDDSKGEET